MKDLTDPAFLKYLEKRFPGKIDPDRLRKIGIATQQHPPKAPRKANLQTAIDLSGSAFVRRTIARPIDEAQHFTGVGQGQQQWMITPGPFVGDVHALLARTGRADQRTIHVDDRPPVERWIGDRASDQSIQAALANLPRVKFLGIDLFSIP
jgi:hypothetical protein